MFEQRCTVRALRKLARERGKARSIRILRNPEALTRRIWLAFVRFLFSTGFGFGCVSLESRPAYALAGGMGALIFIMRWNRVSVDVSAKSILLYPASAERLWTARLKIFLRSAIWSLTDATAIVVFLVAFDQISVATAWAHIPAIIAYGTSMAALPLFLTWLWPSFKPGIFVLPVIIPGLAFMFSAKEFPAVASLMLKWMSLMAWVVPTGWFFHFENATFGPTSRILVGIVAMVAGVMPIRYLAAALERRVIRKEEDADESDGWASSGMIDEEEDIEDGYVGEQFTGNVSWLFKPQIISTGVARELLEKKDWNVFSPPETFLEKLFWRTLNERQRMIVKLLWPFGSRWNKTRKSTLRFAGSCLVIAGALRLVSFPIPAYCVIAFGAFSLFIHAPLLPGCGFIFESLRIGGSQAARCQLLPVSISEISRMLQRCQAIRSIGATWVGAAYGALAWLVMGNRIWVGAMAGILVILFSFGFHPFALIAKLSRRTRQGGRRWVAGPCQLILIVSFIFGLIGIVFGIGWTALFAMEPPPFLVFTISIIGFGVVLRLIGWGLFKLYLLLIDRSWLDAVVKISNKR